MDNYGRALTLFAGFLLLAGCATRYNPVPLYPDKDNTGANQTAFGPPAFFKFAEPDVQGAAPTYQQAVKYARALARAYRHALASDAAAMDALGLLVLGTGSAGIGLGLAGVTGNPFIALGTATGAGVGVGTWLRNPTRRDAFAIGEQALHCVIRETTPFLVFLPRKQEVRRTADELGVAITDLRTAVSELDRAWADVPQAEREGSPLTGRVEAVLKTASAATTAAEEARVAALNIVNTLEAAGPTTFGTVEVIRGHVTTAAVRGQADIATLPEILRSAVQGGYKDIFGAIAKEQAAIAKAKAEEGKEKGEDAKKEAEKKEPEAKGPEAKGPNRIMIFRTKAVGQLQIVGEKLTELVTALDRVQQAVADINIGNIGNAVGHCVNPVAAVAIRRPTPIVVSPSAVVEIVQGKNTFVIVTGGTVASPDDYTLQKFWSDDAKIDVTASVMANGRKYVIAVDENTPPATYYMIVRDIVGQSQAVRIEVKKKP